MFPRSSYRLFRAGKQVLPNTALATQSWTILPAALGGVVGWSQPAEAPAPAGFTPSLDHFFHTTSSSSHISSNDTSAPSTAKKQHQTHLKNQTKNTEQQQRRGFAFMPHPASPYSSPAEEPSESTIRSTAAPSAASSSPAVDPFTLVRAEIDSVSERLRRCILTEIPTLEKAAEYFFRSGHEGKRLRSTIILLMATSLAAVPPSPLFLTVDDSPADAHPPEQRRRQQRVAEITELIHVASLLHDDVIDNADKRRGLKALNSLFGNKVAILAGDFLLARASVSLAALRNSEVIALMSQVLEHLVAGEILQMTAGPEESLSMDHYMKKTFFKTASLVANSSKSVAVLAGCSPDHATAAWEYGRHVGLAFQLVDDILDYTGTAAELGKPAGNDLRSGLATAPVLFAAEEHPQLYPLIQRRFRQDGDVEAAIELVRASSGVARAKELALYHAREAVAALGRLPPPEGAAAEESRRALEEITRKVITRRK